MIRWAVAPSWLICLVPQRFSTVVGRVRGEALPGQLRPRWLSIRTYGVRKMWKAFTRAGEQVGRDQVARLMHEIGVGGARRGRKVRTTRADDTAARPPDLVGLVDRRFVARRPNELWVSASIRTRASCFLPSTAGMPGRFSGTGP